MSQVMFDIRDWLRGQYALWAASQTTVGEADWEAVVEEAKNLVSRRWDDEQDQEAALYLRAMLEIVNP